MRREWLFFIAGAIIAMISFYIFMLHDNSRRSSESTVKFNNWEKKYENTISLVDTVYGRMYIFVIDTLSEEIVETYLYNRRSPKEEEL